MVSRYPNNNQEQSPLSLRRKLLRGGLVGGALVIGGTISEPLWSPFFQSTPSPTLYTYAGHRSGVSSVAWSPDGTRIASVGWDSTIQVWNAKDAQHLLTYRNHPDATDVAWSPDNTRLASAGNNFTIQVWNASTGQQIWTHQDVSENTVGANIAWSPNGKQIATYGTADTGTTVAIRDATSGHLFLNYKGHPFLRSFAWSPDSMCIVSGGWARSVQVWKAYDGQKVWMYQIPDALGKDFNYVNAVTWSPDGTRIASGGSCPDVLFATNGGIQLWDAVTGQKSWAYLGHDSRADIQVVVWSPDGKRIASVETDNIVQVWSPTSGKRLFTYREHTNRVRTVAWSPDGTRIASAGDDRVVRVWKVL